LALIFQFLDFAFFYPYWVVRQIIIPKILFLDEPTTGLDPRSRKGLWDIISELAHLGTTVLLTTQYMEEADHLADKIVVMENGKKIAEGTASELKSRIGGDVLELEIVN
jgi:ABC-2 type transport system ATP-binding protein